MISHGYNRGLRHEPGKVSSHSARFGDDDLSDWSEAQKEHRSSMIGHAHDDGDRSRAAGARPRGTGHRGLKDDPLSGITPAAPDMRVAQGSLESTMACVVSRI